MTVEEFSRRVNNIANPQKFSSLFRGELNDIFSAILYYMANEQITNTAQARFVFADAIADLGSPLYSLIATEVYNLWGEYKEDEREIHNGEYDLVINGLSYYFSTNDKGALLQNSNKAKVPKRERQYKGILGDGYQSFYIDRILRIARATLSGVDNSSMPLLVTAISSLNTQVKLYLKGGIAR